MHNIIIVLSYLMVYRISSKLGDMMYLTLNFLVLCTMIQYHTLTSHLINWCDTLDFCQHSMHDTTYDTFIMASLNSLPCKSWLSQCS
jgi:hypothetical protein